MRLPEFGALFPDIRTPICIESELGVSCQVPLNVIESSVASYTVPAHTSLRDVLTPETLSQLKNGFAARKIDPSDYTISPDNGAVYSAVLARDNANAFSDALWFMKSSQDSTYNPEYPETQAIE